MRPEVVLEGGYEIFLDLYAFHGAGIGSAEGLKRGQEGLVEDVSREAEGILFEVHGASLGSKLTAGLREGGKLFGCYVAQFMVQNPSVVKDEFAGYFDRVMLDDGESGDLVAELCRE